MSEGRMTAEQTPDIEALAEELWASSDSPGASPTDVDRDLARRFLESDWLAAAVREARAAELREAADEWDSCGCRPVCWHRVAARDLRDRADRIAVDAPECNCGWGGVHDPDNPRCARNLRPRVVRGDE